MAQVWSVEFVLDYAMLIVIDKILRSYVASGGVFYAIPTLNHFEFSDSRIVPLQRVSIVKPKYLTDVWIRVSAPGLMVLIVNVFKPFGLERARNGVGFLNSIDSYLVGLAFRFRAA